MNRNKNPIFGVVSKVGFCVLEKVHQIIIEIRLTFYKVGNKITNMVSKKGVVGCTGN